MSLLQTISHPTPPTNGIYNRNSPTMSSPLVVTPAVDSFLVQYVKSSYINTSLNNRELLGEFDESLSGYLLHPKVSSSTYLKKIVEKPSPFIKKKFRGNDSLVEESRFDTKSRSHLRLPHAKVSKVPSLLRSPKVQPSDDYNHIHTILPQKFMDCSVDDLINLLSRMLQSLITLNDKSVPEAILNPKPNESSNLLTRYHSRTPPSISTHKYLSRLTKFNNFNPATLLTTIYYIDLLSHQYQPYFTLNSWTVHRFLLVATMLSQKSMEDFFYTNDHYAKVGGVDISELNCLELDFLSRVDWRCIPAKTINGRSSIKYANEVLELYYFQLIELMGKNLVIGADRYNYSLSTEPSVDERYGKSHQRNTYDNNYVENVDDEGMDDDDDDNDTSNITESPVKSQYDGNVYAFNKGSSPHLKRRYSQYG